MNILDSNLIIYSVLPEYAYLRPLIKDAESCASTFSMLEVLGFHRLDERSKRYFENAFYSLAIIPVSDEILNAAISLRQQRKLSAGDSLIAATALHYDYTLCTRNTSDFDWIPNLRIINPVL